MKIPLSLLAAISLPAASLALGVRVVDQDAAATARAEAWTATADNAAAIFYNPAGITQLDGLTARLGVYSLGIHEHYSPLSGGGGLEAKEKILYVPNFFATYHIAHTPVTVGLGVYAPFGFELDYPDRAPFRTLAKFGSIKFETVEPTVAVQLTRSLSVAAGLTINHAEADLRRGLFAPGDKGPNALPAGGDEFKFEGSGSRLGVNAGIMWKPAPEHSFGISYHSEVQVNLSGHSSAHLGDRQIRILDKANAQIREANAAIRKIKASVPAAYVPAVLAGVGLPNEEIAPLATSFPDEDANAGFHFPQYVSAGYSFRPTPDWNFEADVDWTDWDSLNTVTLHQQHSGDVKLPFNWRSSFIYEFGVTRQLPWGLRASGGYAYSENSVPTDSFNPIVPDGNRHIFSAGLGQTWRRVSWDVAYQLTYGPSREVINNSLADGRYRFHSHAVSISLGYNF